MEDQSKTQALNNFMKGGKKMAQATGYGFNKKKHNVSMTPGAHKKRQKKMKIRSKKNPRGKRGGVSGAEGRKLTPVTDLSNDQLKAKAMKMLGKGGY